MEKAASKSNGSTGQPTARAPVVQLTRKDFETDQDVRWCPGCGDYSILAAVQRVMPTLGIPREKIVFVSGIGCSSRFPYYMNTYGMHGIHGRAAAIATGLKVARPDLEVWVATGDGDGLSIGGNHFIHVLRRNVGIKILLFNNRIYGLTKGQYSPTSELGKKTKSTPWGSIDYPFNPVAVALGAGATFVARAVDVEPAHLQAIVRRAAEHKGSAFVEVYQNCNVFNDGAFTYMTDKPTKADAQLVIEHGKPLRFGKNKELGIRLESGEPQVVKIGENGVAESDIAVWDERKANPGFAFTLAHLLPPRFPTPIGVFRAVERPSYEKLAQDQEADAVEQAGVGELDKLLRSGEVWTVS